MDHQFVANLVEHPPCRFVVDAKLALQLLRGDSASCASHEVQRVEPQLQGRRRPFVDRSLHRVDAVAAGSTEPARSFLRRVVTLEHPLRVTAGTVGMLSVRREALAPQPSEAGLVVGELPCELQQGAGRFRGCGADEGYGGQLGASVAPSCQQGGSECNPGRFRFI